MDNKNRLVLASIVFGIAIVASSIIVANNFYKIKALSDVISVTGSAQKIITSDVVKWKASFSRNVGAGELKPGSGQIKKDLEIVLKFLKESGVDEKEITVFPVSINPNYEQSDGKYYYGGAGGKIIGYGFYQNVQIESKDVEKITNLANNTGSLINQGVVFSSQPLEYYYGKLAELKVEMLAEATVDARARAEKIAESAKSQLGQIKSASMGVMQITPVNSTEVSDYGYYDTTSVEKQINAVVRAAFMLK